MVDGYGMHGCTCKIKEFLQISATHTLLESLELVDNANQHAQLLCNLRSTTQKILHNQAQCLPSKMKSMLMDQLKLHSQSMKTL